jgi:predicted secreted protein
MFPGHLDLRQGETFSLDLPSAGVSGYLWSAEIDGVPDVIRAEIRQRPAGELPPGAAIPEVLLIDALAPGESAVALTQARAWVRTAEPRQSYRIAVTVR